MRAAVVAPVLLVLLGSAAAWLLLRGDGGAAPPGPSAPQPAPTADGARPAPAPAGIELPAPAPATLRAPVDLADHATAHLQVLDADTAAPLAGAAVYRFHRANDEAALAYTDERGRVGLPLPKAEQLVVVLPGYLLRLAPTQPGSTAGSPQLVRLVPDRLSFCCRFRFVRPDGSTPSEVRAIIRPQRDAQGRRQARPVHVEGRPEIERRAWSEQTTIAALMTLPELHVQAGQYNAAFVHLLAGEDRVCFVEDGAFELEAATADGFTGRLSFVSGAPGSQTLTVSLARGGTVAGVVRDLRGPVAGASLRVAAGDPLQLVAHSDAAGRFVLGPLAPGSVELLVVHRDHEPARTPPCAVGSAGVVVAMTELPADTLRGRVRAQPDLAPVGGATVSMLDAAGHPVTATTDADGTFALVVPRQESARLNIAAPGFLGWSELIDPGAPFLEFDLWPGETQARLRAGITGLLCGAVFDASGQPLGDVGVRLLPDRPPAAAAPAGRRVLAGGIDLPLTTRTRPDGTFELETRCAGPGTLYPLDGSAPAASGARVDVQLGKTSQGVRLVARQQPR